MFHVILLEPEIPPNTGNIIRLCANASSRLHLIEPLGFSMADKQLKRAGLDYHQLANVSIYPDLNTCLQDIQPRRVYAFSTKATTSYADVSYQPGDAFLFGPESRGLPEKLLQSLPHKQLLRIPMQQHSRSLNLCNAVAIGLYEAWRQNGFGQ